MIMRTSYNNLINHNVKNIKTKTYKPIQQVDLDLLIDFLLDYTSFQTGIGVQTSRIIQNSMRIAESFGCNVTVMMFQRTVSISLRKTTSYNNKQYTKHITALTNHKAKPINFLLNSELNKFSWYVHENRPTLEEVNKKFQEIISMKTLNRWIMLAMISVATAAFCKLFGGDNISALFVLISTACGFWVKQELSQRKLYIYGITVVSSFISSFIVGLLLNLTIISQTPTIALSTSILYLVPGVPFINAFMDFFDGYILNGWSRLTNAFLILISMTIGITTTLITLDLSLL